MASFIVVSKADPLVFLGIAFLAILIALETPRALFLLEQPHRWKFWMPDGAEAPCFLSIINKTSRWKRTPDWSEADLLWVRYNTMVDESRLRLQGRPGYMVNRIRRSRAMTDKALLHRVLASVGQAALQPTTFDLSREEERKEFFTLCNGTEKNDDVWISKPHHLADGKGIRIGEDPNALYERSKQEDVLVQRYIANPLLLKGKKMEIRTYWLLAGLQDPFLVLMYRDATVRRTSRNFTMGEFADPLVHIANTYRQKEVDPAGYWNSVDERKWSLQRLAEYVQWDEKTGILNGTEWLHEELLPTHRKILETVALAVHPILLDQRRFPVPPGYGWDGHFDLFGMDTILDESLRVWLTEIQMRPNLSLESQVKKQIIPCLIREMLHVLVLLHLGATCRDFADPASSPLDRFQVVLCAMSDR